MLKRIVHAFRHFQDKVSTRWDGDMSAKFRHLKWQVAIMSYLYPLPESSVLYRISKRTVSQANRDLGDTQTT